MGSLVVGTAPAQRQKCHHQDHRLCHRCPDAEPSPMSCDMTDDRRQYRRIIEHMIETLEQVQERVEDDLSASDLLALARDRKAAEDQAAAELLDVAARWADLHPPESIHSAAAFTVPGASTRNPSPARVARWSRSSASPSSAPSSGSRPRRRRSSSATPSSCATASPACGRRSTPAASRRGGPGSVAETTIHSTPALTVEAAGFVDAQVAAVAGRIGTAQLDRLVAETIKRLRPRHRRPGRGSGGRLPRPSTRAT